jgi:hypothetical protein
MGRRRRRYLILRLQTAVVAVAVAVASCSGTPKDPGGTMTTSDLSVPAGWQQIQLDDSVSLSVPPDAVTQRVQPIDSIFGMLRSDGYEIVYDYGRSGDDLEVYAEEEGFHRQSRQVGGNRGTEISFRQSGDPWTFVRLVQVQHERNVLTVRMACVDEETCQSADVLFDSVRFA